MSGENLIIGYFIGAVMTLLLSIAFLRWTATGKNAVSVDDDDIKLMWVATLIWPLAWGVVIVYMATDGLKKLINK